jgi:hypothetical protein
MVIFETKLLERKSPMPEYNRNGLENRTSFSSIWGINYLADPTKWSLPSKTRDKKETVTSRNEYPLLYRRR